MRHHTTSAPTSLGRAEDLIKNQLYVQAKEFILKEEIEAYSILDESYDADIDFFDWLIKENGLSLKALDPSELIKRLPLLDFLVKKHGFDVNEVRKYDRYEHDPILIAAIDDEASYKTIETLIKEYQCDVNYSGDYRGTALKRAVDEGNVKIARLLLENGADPRIAEEDEPVLSEEVRVRYPKCAALVEQYLKKLS